MSKNELIIKIDCKDTIGLVYNTYKILFEQSINIISLQEYVDTEKKYFYAHIMGKSKDSTIDIEALEHTIRSRFRQEIEQDVNISIHYQQKKKIIVFATKEYHCLGEILLRCKYDTLNAEIVAVIANHENDIKHLSETMQVPFYYVPVLENDSREQQELRIQDILAQFDFDYIVLARYMRILSATFTNAYKYKIINIHHSLLPAFIGANPYQQAYDRGVKIIGATAHFVTKNLDEGPIILQRVMPVNHSYTVSNLKKMGRDIEKLTLLDALEKVFDDKVFIHDNKTIVF